MNKKVLIILGIVVGLIIIGLILFLFLYPGKTATTGITTLFGLFPSAGEKITTSPSPSDATTITTPPTIQPGQQKTLIQLVQKAVTGATFTGEGKVRYFEKATGNIYDIDPQGGNTARISNTTIPGIFEVHWSPDGEQAVIRYIEKNESAIEDIARNFSIISISATSTSINGIFLPSAIKTVASSPAENKIFYLTSFENTDVGTVASFEDKKQKQALSTSFGEWLASWPDKNTIGLVSKPSATTEGYFYKLDPVSGSFERVLAGIKGLTVLWSYGGEYVLYSESGYNDLKTNLYETKNKSVLPFSVVTLPEKCVWSKIDKGLIYCAVPVSLVTANYPDDWYQGLISFSDRIWKIDVSKGETEVILDEQENMDIILPFLDANENYLFFQNKKDGTLWSLRLQ